MSRFATIIVLAEDIFQQNLIRVALKKLGAKANEIIIEPPVSGQNDDWVRDKLPTEVAILRKNLAARAVIAVVDADEETTGERRIWLEAGLNLNRQNEEAIAYVIPRRHVETWIWYLEGNLVDETTNYKKEKGGPVKRSHDLANAKSNFAQYIQTGHEPFADCPPSLREARSELRRVFPPS